MQNKVDIVLNEGDIVETMVKITWLDLGHAHPPSCQGTNQNRALVK